jgi:hypothetical protein
MVSNPITGIKKWAVKREKEYLVAGLGTMLITSILAGCIFGLGLGGANDLAGVIGAFGISIMLFCIQCMH